MWEQSIPKDGHTLSSPHYNSLYKVSIFLGILMVSIAENTKVKKRKKYRYRSVEKKTKKERKSRGKEDNGWVIRISHISCSLNGLQNQVGHQNIIKGEKHQQQGLWYIATSEQTMLSKNKAIRTNKSTILKSMISLELN